MKKGGSLVWVIVIAVIVVLAGLIAWWQYDRYQDLKKMREIEDQIMNGTYPGL